MSLTTVETNTTLKVLTRDQTEFFAENGYLVYGRLLTPEQLQNLRREYDAEIDKGRQNGQLENVGDSVKQWYLLQYMTAQNMLFRQLIYHKQLLDITEDLLGPNIQLLYDEAFYKPSRTGSQVIRHRDNTYWQCHPSTAITCWLTLDDVDVSNGAMHVFAGSHLHPSASDDEYDEADAVACEMEAGSVMFHHCWTLHYSPPNETDRERRALGLHLAQLGTRSQIINISSESLFTHPILRMRL